MWYSDPFIALPVLWGTISVMAFGMMVLVGLRGKKLIARIFAAIFAAFVSGSAFAFTFGYYIRHAEEVNKWIGIISQ